MTSADLAGTPVLTSVAADASRRIQQAPEHSVDPASLAQPLDVDVRLSPTARVPVPALGGFAALGVRATADAIARGVELGIGRFMLRFTGMQDADHARAASAGELAERPAEALSQVRQQVRGMPVQLIADPFGVALNADGTWGRPGPSGLDPESTTILIEELAAAMATAGADGIVTLGRLPLEVPATRRGIARAGTATKIYSFSQNSETSTAYVYLDHGHHDTLQKILPGNATEMDLWSLVDIWDGADVCLVKPMENYHVAGNLRRLLDDRQMRDVFLASPRVQAIAALKQSVAEKVAAMVADPARLERRCTPVAIGTYAVSGTTALLALLAERHGVELARARLREMWVNASAAVGARSGPIVDRNASSYLSGGILF